MPVKGILSELRFTLGRLEAALAAVDEGLVFTDMEGTVEWTNHAFDKLVSKPRLLSLGRHLPDLLPRRFQDGREAPTDCLLAWARSGSGTTHWDLTPDPPRRVLAVSWAQVPVPEKPSLIFSFRDQTEIIRAQDELIRARDDLEEKVTQRTAEIRRARDEAIQANQAKTTFLANMSHEIRTPMNAVIGMTEMLMDTDLTDQQKELVQIIHDSGEHLLGLINGILDISRIEANRMEVSPETFKLRTVLHECVTLLKHQFESKQLAVSMSVDPRLPDALVGDVQKLRQIMFNLLSNACKYTLEGGVVLTVEPCDLQGNSSAPNAGVRIHVEDTGVGIEEEFQRIIFDDFTRLVGRVDLPPGTGLGLAITARLCRLMGGSITLSSTVDKGTRFTVELPFSLPPNSEPSKRDGSSGASTKVGSGEFPTPKILVAEDNAVNSRLMAMMLAKLGLDGEFVSDGQAALERVQAGGVDLVFMDIEMPVLDGLEATRRIRRQHPSSPYIIALTAYSFDAQRQDCMKAGMNDFITKPLRLAELRSAMERFQESSKSASTVVG